MRYSTSKDTAFDSETTCRHTFLCRATRYVCPLAIPESCAHNMGLQLVQNHPFCVYSTSWKQASRPVTSNLHTYRDWVIACFGSRIKTFPKVEKLWTVQDSELTTWSISPWDSGRSGLGEGLLNFTTEYNHPQSDFEFIFELPHLPVSNLGITVQQCTYHFDPVLINTPQFHDNSKSQFEPTVA